jgi:hypothetical protein
MAVYSNGYSVAKGLLFMQCVVSAGLQLLGVHLAFS